MPSTTALIRLLLISAFGLMLLACGTKTIESDLGIEGAPDWVNQGTRGLNDNGGRLFHGVGSAPPMDDESLQKATADNRARAELASILSLYMEVAIQDYTAVALDGENTFSEQSITRQIDSAARLNLTGSEIIANWRHPDTGVIYSLAEINLGRVQELTERVSEMDSGVRTHIRTRGDNIFDGIIGAGQ